MALKIQLRRGTASEWTSANPVLMSGEMGVETDTLKVKLGNGSTAWASLPYFTQGVKGDTGATGATGPQGLKGDKGDIGETGPANTLTVGTVTTGAAGSNATVTITGDAPNQTISFTIPQGIQGIQGIQGVKGDTGLGVPEGGTTGYVVQKTVSGTAWVDPTLDFLSDVSITSPSNGQALTYDSATSSWKNATPANNLSQLGDVTITSAADKQVLQYEASSGKWKNKVASGGVTVSEPAPSSPIDGDGWFYSADGTLFIRYNDGNSTQWVQPSAPLSSQIEQRYFSPNYLINGSLEINQRGFTSSTTSDTYGFDRWRWFYSGGTVTHTSQTFTPGDIAEPTAVNFARIVTSGQSAASDRALIFQRMEDVRTLAGKTVTFSFWAKAGSGTPSVAFEVINNYGTGGSTSTNGSVAAGTAGKRVLSGGTSWTRYSFTFTMPSVTGKTIGASSWVSVGLWVSAGSDHASRTDSLGVQNNTFDFWGFQLEEGSTATAFRRNGNSLQEELANCQRYHLVMSGNITNGYKTGADTFRVAAVFFPVQMRVTPTVTATWSDSTTALTNGTNTLSTIPVKNMGNTSTEVILTSMIATAEL